MAGPVTGGAAGRRKGEGYVYIMQDGCVRDCKLKIGCSNEPKRRLREIRRDKEDTKLLDSFGPFEEMNEAETIAQKAVRELGLKKVENNATDWFYNPKRIALRDIRTTVKTALEMSCIFSDPGKEKKDRENPRK